MVIVGEVERKRGRRKKEGRMNRKRQEERENKRDVTGKIDKVTKEVEEQQS